MKQNNKVLWFLTGMIFVIWIKPLVNSFLNIVTSYCQLIIDDIRRESQKSQSMVNAEFPVEVYMFQEDDLDG